ncbi:GNAT family N-acetyltransferase [Parvularcula marina]|uniref:GNAT family N-acetyltransferase n=1 Tax=Parvularcula marina TaxID=2292771 RepID=UPI003515307C
MELTPKLLENDFVRLEPLTESHRDILRAVSDDPEIWALMSERGDGPLFDGWFDRRLADQAAGSLIGHAVFDKATSDCVGHSSFLAIVPSQDRVEVGWTYYTAAARGTAINPAAKLLLFTRAIEAGAARIELKTGAKNFRSQRAMTKLGLAREGVLRSHVMTWKGERRDSVFFSMLPHEWPGVRARLEKRLAAFKSPSAS